MGTHDALFKHAFSDVEHARGVLRTALPAPVAARIDFASLALRETTFVDETLRDRHADLLFSAQIGGREGLLYLLWEHKSEPEALTPLQVLRYLVRIWDHHLAALPEDEKHRARKLPPVVVIVLHHGPGGWTAARRFEDLLDADEATLAALGDHVPRLSLVIDDLASQPDDALYERAASAFARLVLWCLKNARDAGWLLRDQRRWTALLREVLARPDGLRALTALVRYILGTNPRAEPEALRRLLPDERTAEIEEVVMNWYQEQVAIEAERRSEEKARNLLLKQLRLRFGDLPAAVVGRVESADPALLDRWVERFVTASALEDVFAPV